MPDLPRSHLIAYALAAVAILAFGWRQVAHSRAADVPSGVPIAADGAGTDGVAGPDGAASAGSDGADSGGGATSGSGSGDQLVVHVAGWVRRPGVYRLADGLRVDDALKAAGGARRGADLSQLNLAMKLEDGRQVLVPRRAGCAGGAAGAGACDGPAATGGGAAPSAPAAGGAAAGGAGAATPGAGGLGATGGPLVNLNQATVEQLDTLQGVGPVTAANIVAYRDEQGGFGSVDELGEIPGIGPARLESLRAQVTL